MRGKDDKVEMLGIIVRFHVHLPVWGQLGDAIAICGQLLVKIVFIEAAVFRDLDMNHISAAAPGKIVGVMLHLGGDDDGIRFQRLAVSQFVERLGAVIIKDAGIGFRVCTNKAQDDLMRLIVGDGAQP